MKKVGIKADLERRLRAAASGEEIEEVIVNANLVKEIVALLDKEDAKRAASSEAQSAKSGLGYKELVALFRFQLGDDLALPPSPSVAWIVRIVNKARDQGINLENVEQIVRGLRASFKPPYSLDFIVFRAAEHFEDGRRLNGGSPEIRGAGGTNEVRQSQNVYTGRPVPDVE